MRFIATFPSTCKDFKLEVKKKRVFIYFDPRDLPLTCSQREHHNNTRGAFINLTVFSDCVIYLTICE